MINRIRPFHVFLFILCLISLFYLKGVASVPFHPDESSYLYMSSDLSKALKNPTSLNLREGSYDERTKLRLLDPPLVHYLVEIGRRLGGYPPLSANWLWSLTWTDNDQRGALPSPGLLLAGRLAVASLFPFSLLFLYLATRLLSNEFTAWIAVLLMASNSVILLHTRRAMAEGIMIFTLTLTLWILYKAEKRPWLASVPIGLAFCAKQSLATLAVVGFIAIIWQKAGIRQKGHRAWQALCYVVLFIFTIYLLTPIAWIHPVQAIRAAANARQGLLTGQMRKYPDDVIRTPGERAANLINQIYFAPLRFYEDPRYTENIQANISNYMGDPWNTLFRSLLSGYFLMALSLFGLASCSYQIGFQDPTKKRRCILLLIATLLQTITLLVAIPLNWQRYYLPLLPFACIWVALGINRLQELLFRTRESKVVPG